MSEYQITCCSTADMPAQYFEEKKIPFVCFNFLMDGVQSVSYTHLAGNRRCTSDRVPVPSY